MIPALDTIHILLHLGYQGRAFLGHDPDVIGTYISIRDTAASGSNAKWARDTKRIQVLAKADAFNHMGAYEELDKVRNLLFGVNTVRVEEVDTNDGKANRISGTIYQGNQSISTTVNQLLNTVDYIRYIVTSDIEFITLDDNNRPIYTLNFELTRDWNNDTGNREAF